MLFSTTHLQHLSTEDQTLFQLYGWGGTQHVPYTCLHHAFEHHALTQPSLIAVEDNLDPLTRITYGELDARANQLANHLLETYPYIRGGRVCLLVRRSVEMIIAILGVMKAGAAYVPLDAVTITDEQLKFVLSDSGAGLVLSMRGYQHRVPDSVALEELLEDLERKGKDDRKPADLTTGDDGIYVIYTSGTTGQPKGVDVRHKGATNVVCLSPGNVGMRPGYRVAQILNIAFDMCAWEVLSSLANGCTICLRGNTSTSWSALLKTVHVLIATPSILSRHDPSSYPQLKHVIVGGEPCPQQMADLWSSTLSLNGGIFNNCCGPTEISIANTVQPHLVPGYPLSIGRPIPNTAVYILNEDGSEAAPIGEMGYMWVGGVGVSNGYLNLPERNKERWREDPFIPGGRMFNTNDLGRWRPDGQLDHLGRADDQVKVKGFRVEPDGVGAAIRTHPKIEAAVVLLIENELWGFVVPFPTSMEEREEETEQELVEEVRSTTAKTQPYYAVPTRWKVIQGGFPMTRNGKVDKRALRGLVSSPPLPASAPASSSAGSSSSSPSLHVTLPPSSFSVSSLPPPSHSTPPCHEDSSASGDSDGTAVSSPYLPYTSSTSPSHHSASPLLRLPLINVPDAASSCPEQNHPQQQQHPEEDEEDEDDNHRSESPSPHEQHEHWFPSLPAVHSVSAATSTNTSTTIDNESSYYSHSSASSSPPPVTPPPLEWRETTCVGTSKGGEEREVEEGSYFVEIVL